MKYRLLFLTLLLLAGACRRDATGPAERDVQVSALAGDQQFALPGAELGESLQVMVIDAVSERPVDDVQVSWRVIQGSATVVEATTTTDGHGIASNRVRLGSQLGAYVIEATAKGQVGAPVRFRAEAVAQPVLTDVSPASAAAGQTVVLTGSHFNPQPDYNAVLFDGIRGRVLTATATRIEAVVPSCIPTRTVSVQVWIGGVSSGTAPLAATGVPGSTLALERGQVRSFAEPADLGCLRLPGAISAARYLVVAQNVATAYSAPMPFVLATYDGAGPVASPALAAVTLPSAERFELSLRRQERAWVADAAALRASLRTLHAQLAEPRIGERRSFKVLKPDNTSVEIQAEVKAVSDHAVLYQDLEAPAGGFTAADFTYFGQLFDNPIYDTDVAVFGSPSDIDANGRVIILFTPRVNGLTKRGDASVIAGYFYGCDLVAKTRCANTNSGEIFYSMVPDPQAKFGDARQTNAVLRSVPPVLAHELQHMIGFANRQQTLDALWLSEGLAHTAEDVVGQVFEQRGDVSTARDFMRGNYLRAARYLAAAPRTSLIAENDPGTLELRGGAWLLVRYLRAHYGGDAVLRKLTSTTLSSTANVTAQTGQSWASLFGDFAIALYATENGELSGAALDPRYGFGTLPIRREMIEQNVLYSLLLTPLPRGDGGIADALPSSSSSYFVLDGPPTTDYPPINLVFAGTRGGPFSGTGQPQLLLLRVR